MAATGDRKFTGNNLGCTLRDEFPPIPFPNHPATGFSSGRASHRLDAPPCYCAPKPPARIVPGNHRVKPISDALHTPISLKYEVFKPEPFLVLAEKGSFCGIKPDPDQSNQPL